MLRSPANGRQATRFNSVCQNPFAWNRTPDNKQVAAIMSGSLLLAGDLGPRREGPGGNATRIVAPLLVAAERPVSEWVVPSPTRAGDFVAAKVARDPAQPAPPVDVALAPFYRTHRRTYSAYFDVVTAEEFDARVRAATAERERVRKLEAATVAFVQPGDADREKDFNYQSDPANRQPQRTNGRAGRGGSGWFSYDVPVELRRTWPSLSRISMNWGSIPRAEIFRSSWTESRLRASSPTTRQADFSTSLIRFLLLCSMARPKPRFDFKLRPTVGSRRYLAYG